MGQDDQLSELAIVVSDPEYQVFDFSCDERKDVVVKAGYRVVDDCYHFAGVFAAHGASFKELQEVKECDKRLFALTEGLGGVFAVFADDAV